LKLNSHGAAASLEQRRANGEIMTYVRDGWVFQEFPGKRVERICRLEELNATDYPLPAPAVCQD